MKLTLLASALALACLMATNAAAQSLSGTPIYATGSKLPAVATYCDDGTGHAAICSSGGGGGGDASAANQTAVQANAGSDASKAVAVQGVAGGKAVKVDGSAVTQPISASALPLPTGAATSANQATANTSLATIATNTTGAATAANQSTLNGYVDGLEGQLAGVLTVQQVGNTSLWRYAAASGGIVNTTTAVTLKSAPGASTCVMLQTLTLSHDALGGATEVAVRDGAAGTVVWRGRMQTTALEDAPIRFDPPLKGTANTLMELATLTAVTGGVYVNATGYSVAC